MKILLTISFFALLLSATLPAYGQRAEAEVYPEQVSINHNDAVKSFSRDFVTTLSRRNSANMFGSNFDISNMAAINVWGDGNTAFFNQQGAGLLGAINVFGDENQASLSQSGSNLVSILTISGDYNHFDMTQQGVGLNNALFLIGSGLNFDAVQTNSGFELRQGGQTSIPISIQHTGQLPPLIIERN
ncbi:MAG: curlin repeat-containing protein [Balneolaceae bacterium]|nr:curlin repeat-containing protein [Balneolaceae bacterium]